MEGSRATVEQWHSNKDFRGSRVTMEQVAAHQMDDTHPYSSASSGIRNTVSAGRPEARASTTLARPDPALLQATTSFFSTHVHCD